MSMSKSPLHDLVAALCTPYGGLTTADALASRLQGRVPQPLSWLARHIVTRELISLPDERAIWLPAFQFTPAGDGIQPGVALALQHLRPGFNDWEIALWFTLEHPALDLRRPVELLGHDDAAVLHTAEADARSQPAPAPVPCGSR